MEITKSCNNGFEDFRLKPGKLYEFVKFMKCDKQQMMFMFHDVYAPLCLFFDEQEKIMRNRYSYTITHAQKPVRKVSNGFFSAIPQNFM